MIFHVNYRGSEINEFYDSVDGVRIAVHPFCGCGCAGLHRGQSRAEKVFAQCSPKGALPRKEIKFG
jgi:hypothetical protein